MGHEKLEFEYSQITPQIYIGTNQCCQMHFDQELIKRGIRADISMEEKRVDVPLGVNYYLWLPVKDRHAPTQDQLAIGVQFLDALIKRKHKVYVHCQHGHGRAPTLVAAYLAVKGMNAEAALELIKTRRPGSHLNKIQMTAVKKFTKYAILKKYSL